MEVVREFIDASKLASVISLPEALKNRKLEIIVLPAEENVKNERQDNQVEDIVDLLTGIIPDNRMTLEDYRMERLGRYENID